MFEDVEARETEEAVLRLASTVHESVATALLRHGIDPGNIEATLAALDGVGIPLTAQEAVDMAFVPRGDKPTPFPIGRFGDGSMGVYYSALGEATCQRELAFHLHAAFLQVEDSLRGQPRYYSLVACLFSGAAKDFRGVESIYPDLVSESTSGYPFCQSLGRLAVKENIDGFLTASARSSGGTCVPVFARAALSDPEIRHEVTLMISAAGVEFRRRSSSRNDSTSES